MKAPDWRKVELNQGILREPFPDNSKIVLWVPAARDGGYQYWERIGSLPHSEFIVEAGICAVAATSVRAKQATRGFLGRLFGASGDGAWLLPTGQSATQCGDRQTDILLVWAENEATPLGEALLKARWPQGKRLERIGANLYLVSGVEESRAGQSGEPAQEAPTTAAERLLAAARAAGDRDGEASALADLGAVLLHGGKGEQAVAVLGEALAIVRQLGDRSRESDVLGNLGLVTMAAGHPGRALEIFVQELALARESGDQFAEKMALERMGLAQAKLNESLQAVESFGQALAIARELGHRKHQADLLWYLGIQYAELGRRDQAIEHAKAALELMERMHNPEAAWFAQHLEKYRSGQTGGIPGTGNDRVAAESQEASLGGSIVPGMWAPSPQQALASQGPGFLRMAVSAARSMAKFIGSGLKVTPAQVLHQRLRTCAACEHHTGVRCRLCGCFTNAKARLDHEECPIGKWPAQST
jgi:tetratricopeptide (TPR) repeat protein